MARIDSLFTYVYEEVDGECVIVGEANLRFPIETGLIYHVGNGKFVIYKGGGHFETNTLDDGLVVSIEKQLKSLSLPNVKGLLMYDPNSADLRTVQPVVDVRYTPHGEGIDVILLLRAMNMHSKS